MKALGVDLSEMHLYGLGDTVLGERRLNDAVKAAVPMDGPERGRNYLTIQLSIETGTKAALAQKPLK